jgi:hypothetical protein
LGIWIMRIAVVLNEELKGDALKAAAKLLSVRLQTANLSVAVRGRFVIVRKPSDQVLGVRADAIGLLKARASDGKMQEFDLANASSFAGWGKPGFFLPCEVGELLMGLIAHIKEEPDASAPAGEGSSSSGVSSSSSGGSSSVSLAQVLKLSKASNELTVKAAAIAEASSLTRALEVMTIPWW